ncbi:MAG: dihydrofolate reductase [Mycoplasmatales bacterium]
MLAMILAMDNNNLVGSKTSKNGIPWDYPEDMAFYKKMTIGKKNIMGRVTYDQIGFPLPKRETYVMTRDKKLTIQGAHVINSVDEVISLNNNDEEIMVTGGVDIFELLKEYIDIIYLTKINCSAVGDVYYKNFTTDGYKLVDSHKGTNEDLTFEKWEKC